MDTPRIDRSVIPPEEYEAADYIERNLSSLRLAAESFQYTLDFYLHIRELKRVGMDVWRNVAWTKIAGRNGAIEAYGFSSIMKVLNSTKPPVIRSKMDLSKRKEATALFSKEFANVAGVRNSTAYPGLFSINPKEMDTHRMKQPADHAGWTISEDNGIVIQDSMAAGDDNLLFSASFRGRLDYYELSPVKAAALNRVAQLYCECFFPLESPIAGDQREQRRQSDERRLGG